MPCWAMIDKITEVTARMIAEVHRPNDRVRQPGGKHLQSLAPASQHSNRLAFGREGPSDGRTDTGACASDNSK